MEDLSIVDVHEHVATAADAARLVTAMDAAGVRMVWLMGSSLYTLTLDPQYGFEGFDANNEVLLEIKRRWPGRFKAFITLEPSARDSVHVIRDYRAHGADGLKLYAGHGGQWGAGHRFHVLPLDDSRLEPLFSWLEAEQFPVVMHVNLGQFWGELSRLLARHPKLRVNLPHLGVSASRPETLERLSMLFGLYDNLYSDLSFGQPAFQLQGFLALSRDWRWTQSFMVANRARLLFGTDMVVDSAKDDQFLRETLRSYRLLLETRRVRFDGSELTGLALPYDVLREIYEVNPETFLGNRPH